MERLTEKRDGQNVIPLRQNGKIKWSICSAGLGDAPTKYLYGDHADRLAAIEDILGDEYDLDELKEVVQAKREGRCAEIHYMPAADVAPVRHGRWIEDERTYPGPGLKNNLCSACGEVAGAWKEGLEPGRKWAYCPNCGALMEKKEDEHD